MGAYNVVSRAAMAAGQPEDISIVLANLDAIAAVLNGGIDNSNINAAAAILASKLAGYPADVTKALRGDGTWGGLTAASTALNIGAANTDLAAPAGTDNYWVATTAGGTLRSIGAGAAGARITLKNGTAAGFIRLLHATAGGAGAQLSIINAGHKFLAPGQSIELRYDGVNWQEVNRPAQELICDLTLAASQANFDTDTILGIASSLPQVYSHLVIELFGRTDQANPESTANLRINNDATGSYNYWYTSDNVAGAISSTQGAATTQAFIGFVAGGTAVAAAFGVVTVNIPNYASAATKRTGVSHSIVPYSNTQMETYAGGFHLFDAAAAITRLAINPGSGNWVAGSRFSLYGIT